MKIVSTPSPTAAAEAPQKEDAAIKRVSQQYEALFINQLVGAMRKTVNRGGLVPESHAEKVYQGMLDYEYSQKMAESDQIGLSHLIYEQLLRTQSGR